MKHRTGFVSNSSSSSFIILNDESLIDKSWIKRKELNEEQKKRLVLQGFLTNTTDKVFLTQFISDANDCELFYTCDKTDSEYKKNIISYLDGGHHGGPYSEEAYDQIADNVWLHKSKENLKNEN
jgi:hypothetical protein